MKNLHVLTLQTYVAMKKNLLKIHEYQNPRMDLNTVATMLGRDMSAYQLISVTPPPNHSMSGIVHTLFY